MDPKSKVLVLCLLALIMMFTVGTTAYADSDRSGSGNLGKKIAGAYLVKENDNPTSLRLITLTADGNWLSTESRQQILEFGFSDQQGVWKKTGSREITATVIDFDFDLETNPGNPMPMGVTRIQFFMTFSKDFHEVRGEFFGKDFTFDQNPLNPKENPVSTFEATFIGKRVTVQVEKDDD